MQMPYLKTVLLYSDAFQEEKALILQMVWSRLQLAATNTSLLESTHSREWHASKYKQMGKQLQDSKLA